MGWQPRRLLQDSGPKSRVLLLARPSPESEPSRIGCAGAFLTFAPQGYRALHRSETPPRTHDVLARLNELGKPFRSACAARADSTRRQFPALSLDSFPIQLDIYCGFPAVLSSRLFGRTAMHRRHQTLPA